MLYALATTMLMILFYSLVIEPRRLTQSWVDITIDGLDPALDGYVILHLSDLHQARFGSKQKRLAKIISRRNYDLAVITGDFVSAYSAYDFTPIAELLASIQGPVYAVFGNHDYLHREALAADLLAFGTVILDNSWRLERGALQVVGVEDPSWTIRHPKSPYKTELGEALHGVDPQKFTLLLSHSPAILPDAVNASIPLVLCGHTHGGQVKIPFLGAPTTASGKLFDPYVQGLYKVRETRLYINRGLGTSGLPLRFLSPPEAAFICLRKT